MEYKLKVNDKGYYKGMLRLFSLNPNYALSDLEIDILTTMLCNKLTVVNADSKEVIRKVLDKDKFIVNNYIKRLRDKGILIGVPNSKHSQIVPSLLDYVKEGKVSFEFEIVA
jgi:hypothetical protein